MTKPIKHSIQTKVKAHAKSLLKAWVKPLQVSPPPGKRYYRSFFRLAALPGKDNSQAG